MIKIVIVEDDCYMRDEIVAILEKEQYQVSCVVDFVHAAEEVLRQSPDLVLLDLNLPEVSGFEICKGIRQKSTVPILVLTGRNQLKDELHALGLGADEYLNKPCHKERLLIRITNLLKRSEDRRHFIEVKGLRLDVQTYTLYSKDNSLVLPENQGKIMGQLLSHYGEIVTSKMLIEALWGTTEYIDENALQVNMTRLRKTISQLEIAFKITTIRGEGYQFEAIEEMRYV
ncbi:DNA-binding response regulator, OmpR family, contains REC and winged-helix (wHTH) domain [Anaerocolumna jejuensis DSM 15929]|uniref:Stage 0 sporulation protein A homolog n=1 Tax=Anaerocolumna jejuensis DSM 15929 TaxID=1121322 RepID=A0A1M7DDI8_9FIRM|nr:response regulator transcription factor [Anaerocolumna jejuensis]SHL77544.1 DNA-binding response regulator, OmpR family, contains REC and winged-helix (wHTH) domain [Anaerocolumna jejuensis DSM 15929]